MTPAFSFGVQVAEVEIDRETGEVKVDKIYTAHDGGTVINRTGVEGQLEGSIQMGLGYALYEKLSVREGMAMNTTLLDYKVPTAMDMPQGEAVCIETYEPEGPMGAKEAGEGLVAPTTPAIAEAVYNATGYRCRHLPIMASEILKHMHKEGIK